MRMRSTVPFAVSASPAGAELGMGQPLGDNVQRFSYKHDNVGKITGADPVSLIFKGKEFSLDGKWSNLPEKVCNALEMLSPCKLHDIVGRGSVHNMALNPTQFRKGRFVKGAGVWYEANCSAREFVQQTRRLFKLLGVGLEGVSITYTKPDECKDSQKSPSAKAVCSRATACDGKDSFVKDIEENYPNGFDFSESSKRLVEERVGCSFSNAVVHRLQSHMFERKDGLWFFEDQISNAGLRFDIAAQCKRWLEENPIVNLTQFVGLVGNRVSNLDDDFDKGKYAEYVISRSEFGKHCDFNGKRGGRICFRAGIGANAAKREFAGKVEELLRDRSDAIPVSELADLFPMVSEDWMVGNLTELLPDAILEDVGDRSFALKLLEFYYLPDDFTEVFNSVTEGLSADDEVLSVTRIMSELSDRYGYDFKSSFALSENAFKQIASRADREHRRWVGAILGGVDDGGKERLTFTQIVERQFPRLFSHEEFYRFGTTAWGWSEGHRAWHHKQLWNSFIRYDAEHWSPVDYFKEATEWNEHLEMEVSAALRALLGTSPFFSMNKVPQQFLDELPDLTIEGQQVRWTLELLASVAYFCLPHVRVLNHAAAPYAVSSLLVPFDVPADTDGVAYMVRVFKLRNPYAPGGNFGDLTYQDQAMKFLLENDVRQKSSQKLQLEVAELLRREDI